MGNTDTNTQLKRKTSVANTAFVVFNSVFMVIFVIITCNFIK